MWKSKIFHNLKNCTNLSRNRKAWPFTHCPVTQWISETSWRGCRAVEMWVESHYRGGSRWCILMMLPVPVLTLFVKFHSFTILTVLGKVMLNRTWPVATDSFLLPRSLKQFFLQGVWHLHDKKNSVKANPS